MKKVLTFGLMLFVAIAAVAQNFDYGVIGGLVLSHPKGLRTNPGFSVGAKGMLALGDNPSHGFIDMQLKFTSRGWKDDIAVTGEDGRVTGYIDEVWDIYYLELPIHVGYSFCLTDKADFFFDLGPYFAVGLFGKAKAAGDEMISNVFTENAYKRFDYGVGGNIGIRYDHVHVAFGINHTLMSPTKIEGYAWDLLDVNPKDMSFIISVAYMIK